MSSQNPITFLGHSRYLNSSWNSVLHSRYISFLPIKTKCHPLWNVVQLSTSCVGPLVPSPSPSINWGAPDMSKQLRGWSKRHSGACEISPQHYNPERRGFMNFQLLFTAAWSRPDHTPPLPLFPSTQMILPNFLNYRQYSEHAEFGRFGLDTKEKSGDLCPSGFHDLSRQSHGSLFRQEVGEHSLRCFPNNTSQGSIQMCLVPTERPLRFLPMSLQLLH